MISKKKTKKFDDYFTEYNKLSYPELISESKSILNRLNNKSVTNKENLNNRYQVLKSISQKRLFSSYKYPYKIKFYPDYEDPDFNKKIYSKTEFNINKMEEIPTLTLKDTDILSKKKCNPLFDTSLPKDKIKFRLTQNQKFLKSFLSPNTPYNSLLLFHGTGVGKTCSSISIVEQYSEELKKYDKKITVLMKPSLEDNYRKNIFDIRKVIAGTPNLQCTRDKYLKELKTSKDLTPEKINKKINKIIKGRYNFSGYQEFANKIEKVISNLRRQYPPEKSEYLIDKQLKKMFSNSVMIIDEAHNIKEGSGSKVLPPLLDRVLKNADNMKLILLTATPMFDSPSEIVWLINLLLTNDNRALIKQSDFFKRDGSFIKGKETDFIRKITGYISYMRGEDPIRFPARIYADLPNMLEPSDMSFKNKDGKLIPMKNRIKELKLFGCVLQGFQRDVYESMEKGGIKEKTKFGNFNMKGIQTSLIVYPNSEANNTRFNIDNHIGDIGFDAIIEKKAKYTLKDEFSGFFDIKTLENFSCKIAEFIKNISKSEGIIFVYSKYIKSGILPLALALEYNGYQKYDGSLISDKVKSLGKYIILSGSEVLSPKNTYKNYLNIQKQNMNGEKVKIIIGTETAAEGLDFSYIRQVHILEPWFHLNKIEQIIGRGIRNCSHIDLPIEKRNVSIFMYVAIKSSEPKKDFETLDLELYRRAELKSRQMGYVEYLIKRSAIDCNLNKNGNIFPNDIDYSKKCNYEKCDYKCIPDLDSEETELNSNTLNSNKVIEDILLTEEMIMNIFDYDDYFTFDEIVKLVDVEKNIIIMTLNKLIDDNLIIYRNGFYLKSSIDSNKLISFNNLKTNKRKMKPSAYNISKIKTITNKKNTLSNNLENISSINPIIILEQIINENQNLDIFINRFIIPKKTDKLLIKDMKDNILFLNIARKLMDLNNYYFDYLPFDVKEIVIQYLILNKYKKSLKSEYEDILNKCYNIIYFTELYPDHPDKKEIWGYKILKSVKKDLLMKYIKFDKSKFVPGSKEETQLIERSIIKKNETILPPNEIIGYLDIKFPDNKVVFKIRDKIGEGKKKTQKKTGSICDNDGMKIIKVIEYIHRITDSKFINLELLKKTYWDKKKKEVLDSKDSKKNPLNKDFVCYLCKILLMYYNITSDEYRYFFNVEETYELKINEK